jgi:mRNA interferase MazF
MPKGITTNTTFTKNFEDWGNLKPKLDESDHKPPFAKEGEVWWCNCGENIGSEIYGKGKKFLRPFAIINHHQLK